MRPIEFRARNANIPRCWIYGYFTVEDGSFFIINKEGKFSVISGTESQFVGLLDKNGKKIFEGDIVRHDDPPYWNEERKPTEDDKRLFRGGTASVIFVPFGFEFKEIDCGEWRFNGPEGNEWYKDELEIIGNIYENPELLEKKAKEG